MRKLFWSAVGLPITIAACGGGAGSAGVPSELKGEKMGGGFHLSWKDNSNDEEEFLVEQKAGGAAFAEFTRLPFNTTQHMVESGEVGQEYRFRVRAKLPGGLTEPSNEVMWTPENMSLSGVDGGTHNQATADAGSDAGTDVDGGVTTPGIPNLVSATLVSHGTVALVWQNPASTCATVEINRKKNTGSYSVAQTVSGQSTSAQDSPGHTSGTYCYTMTCKLNGFASTPSNEKCVTQ